MDKSINVKDIQMFLDLCGEPTKPGHICLSTGHGHYAYVETGVSEFICELFMEMSVWGGPTNTYKTHDYRYFKQFELDCSVKAFLKSRPFKRICEHHNVKFIILDDGDEYNQIMREFWDQMRR